MYHRSPIARLPLYTHQASSELALQPPTGLAQDDLQRGDREGR